MQMAAKMERKTERVVVRLTAQDMEALRGLSEAWGCGLAEAARKAIRAAGRVQDMARLGGVKVPVTRKGKASRSGVSRGKMLSDSDTQGVLTALSERGELAPEGESGPFPAKLRQRAAR